VLIPSFKAYVSRIPRWRKPISLPNPGHVFNVLEIFEIGGISVFFASRSLIACGLELLWPQFSSKTPKISKQLIPWS
jgi:hypothetical protein